MEVIQLITLRPKRDPMGTPEHDLLKYSLSALNFVVIRGILVSVMYHSITFDVFMCHRNIIFTYNFYIHLNFFTIFSMVTKNHIF